MCSEHGFFTKAQNSNNSFMILDMIFLLAVFGGDEWFVQSEWP